MGGSPGNKRKTPLRLVIKPPKSPVRHSPRRPATTDDELLLSDGAGSISRSDSEEASSEQEVLPVKLTARQRAKQEAAQTPVESVSATVKVEVEEATVPKRKRTAGEDDNRRLEESKAATIQKLLHKQSVRSKKMMTDKPATLEMPAKEEEIMEEGTVRYLDTRERTLLLVPEIRPMAKSLEIRGEKCQVCGSPRAGLHARLQVPVCGRLACHRRLL